VVRFLHTADWQLGMTRHFLDEEAQGRFSQARIDVIARMAELAAERDCAFVVVAGDVFETNQPDRRTLGRALEALAAFTVPVYLLPGNHDAYDAGSVYRSAAFVDRCPDGVEVLADRTPRNPTLDVEVVGVPWPSKHPVTDLIAEACGDLPDDGRLRVVVAHGAADVISGDHDQAGQFRLAEVEPAVVDGRLSYLALGDRHSTVAVGDSGRIWFSGAPEPTGYREEDPGNCLIVDLDVDPPAVEPVHVGTWAFHLVARSVDGDDDLDLLFADLDAIPDRSRAIVKLKVDGTLTLAQAARLEAALDERAEVFGALEHPERHRDITIVPDAADIDALPVSGYAAIARDRLRDRVEAGGEDARAATDALGLLVRLSDRGDRVEVGSGEEGA
jgi:DNA repair exonuclease SbcCD nuclease subunit